MVKEAKDTEMAMAKAVEGSEHDLEPRKLEYSPSRKPRLAPDPPELGDTRVGSIALMAFCFVGLQVPRCPPLRGGRASAVQRRRAVGPAGASLVAQESRCASTC